MRNVFVTVTVVVNVLLLAVLAGWLLLFQPSSTSLEPLAPWIGYALVVWVVWSIIVLVRYWSRRS